MTRLQEIRIRPVAAAAALLLAIAGRPAVASAQDPDPRPAAPPGPLDAVVRAALEDNLALARESLGVERADAAVREARARFLPDVTLDARWSEQHRMPDLGTLVNPAYAALNEMIGESRFPTGISFPLVRPFEAHARFTQPLFDLSIIAGYAAARHSREAREHRFDGAARQLAADAQSAYLLVGAAASARRTWEATLARVEESERTTARLVDAGVATPDALFRARAERSEVAQQLADAAEAEHQALRELNRLLRRPLDTPVAALPDSLLPRTIPLTLDEALRSALERREELAATDAAIRGAEARGRVATASFLPRLTLALDYGLLGNRVRIDRDDEVAVASLVVSWNLFNGGGDLARREQAGLDAEAERLRRAELEDVVRADVARAWEGAQVALAAIETADARLDAAQRTWELVRRRHAEGMASQLELVDARTALTAAELNRVTTLYRFALHYVDLERAAALRTLD